MIAIGPTVALALGAACLTRTDAPVQPLPALVVEEIAAPGAPGSVNVQLASASGRTIISWVEGTGPDTTLRFAERTSAGWSDPMTVVSGAQLMVNPADVASVHPLAGGALAAQWLEENGPDPEAYDLRLAWSSNGGRTWTPALSPHDDGTRSQHGFASLFESSGGGLGLVWLDGRAAAGGVIGDTALRAAAYLSPTVQSRQSVVDSRVCECCQTAAAATADGIVVAYRDRSPDEIRDIYVVRSEGDGWSAPSPVHRDGWKIHGCPVNGPAISAQGRAVVVAWFTVRGAAGQAFLAFSNDGGRRFGSPIRIDDAASAGRVQVVLLDDGSAVAGWIESDGVAAFKARRVSADGSRGPAVAIATAIGRQYPRLVRHSNELVFAWGQNIEGSTRLRAARAALQQ